MRVRAAVLTLAFALGVAGYACAEESGNWLTRWFTSSAQKSDPDKASSDKAEPAKVAMPPSVSRAMRLAKKAKADWERRTEVIDKLRGIAIESGDDALLQKVEQLDKKSWDLYMATTDGERKKWDEPAPEPEAKKGNRK
jgi:hypothetical protein